MSFFSGVKGAMGAQQTPLTDLQPADGERWGRLVAAVQGPDSAVHVSNDDADAIYRVTPPD